MARYDQPESQGVGSQEFHGLSGADLLGLSPSSHASMAMWRLQYSPKMWLGATTGQFKWGGSMLIGGGIPKGFLQGVSSRIGDRYGGRAAKKGLNLMGNVIGGWEGNFVDPLAQSMMKERGYNVFSRSGSTAFREMHQTRSYYRAMLETGWRKEPIWNSANQAWSRKTAAGAIEYADEAAMAAGRKILGEKTMSAASSQLWRLRALKIMGGANVVLTTALLADIAANLAYGGVVATNALAQRLSTSNLLDMTSGANVVGAYGASTERQRALQAIQANNLNARRFLGSEGAMMHQ